MEIDKIWENYCERMAQIELYHRAAKDIAKEELIKLNKYADALKSKPEITGVL